MVGLEDAVLVWAEFLQLGFEERGVLVGRRFLVQDEDAADVVGVDLVGVISCGGIMNDQ